VSVYCCLLLRCRPCSYSAWDIMYQQLGMEVRFTNFCELMMPAFEMALFNSTIRETLQDAYTGEARVNCRTQPPDWTWGTGVCVCGAAALEVMTVSQT
jgi:hypothetical protein